MTHDADAPLDDVQLATTRAAFEAALRAGDAAAAASVYTEDATLLPPAADLVSGRAAIERFWATGVETGVEAMRFEALLVRRSGDHAVELGRYALTMAPAEGSPIVDRGRYLIVHRAGEDGTWRRAAEMFSPDSPPTPARP